MLRDKDKATILQFIRKTMHSTREPEMIGASVVGAVHETLNLIEKIGDASADEVRAYMTQSFEELCNEARRLDKKGFFTFVEP